MPLLAYAVKLVTLGTVNYQTGNLILKDIFTGTGNMLKSVNDKLFHDFNDGIWIGKKPFKKIGFSSYLIQNRDLNNLNYVLRVDGQNWHLRTDGVEYGQPQIVRSNQPVDDFQWFYKGQKQRDIQQIVGFLNQKFTYHGVVLKNGQLVVKALYYFVRKLADFNSIVHLFFKQDVAELILGQDNTPNTIQNGLNKLGIMRIIGEIKSMIMP